MRTNGPGKRPAGGRFAWRPASGLILGFMLAAPIGCSKAEEQEPETTYPSAGAEVVTPKEIPAGAMVIEDIELGVRGGRVVLGIAGDPKTFNEPLANDTASTQVLGFMIDGLYGYDNFNQQDIPALAETWEYNEETQEWTFHLREGLRWSDGHPLTSDDLLFYVEIARDPSVESTTKDYLEVDGQEFEFSAPDPLTFIAKIPVVDSFALMNLGLIRAYPRHKYESILKSGKFMEALGTDTAPEDLLSSGPFKLKKFVSGERVVLERNPYYYKYDKNGTQLPYFDEIIMLNVPNQEAMELRFQAGDIDYLETIQAANLPSIQDGQDDGNYSVSTPGLSLSNNHWWFNQHPGGSYDGEDGEREKWTPERPGQKVPAEIAAKNYKSFVKPHKLKWFLNEEFRKACSMATNREAIVRTILYGQGQPIYGLAAPANQQWFNPDIPKYKYDLVAAGKTLDAIGYIDRDGDGVREDPEGNPIAFTIITNKENGVREKVGVLLKEDMTKIGFNVTLQLLDFNNILTKLRDNFEYEASLLGLGSGIPPHPAMSANILLSSARMHTWYPSQKSPATPWEAEIDRLYHSMKKTFSLAEQRKIFFEIQDIWAEHQSVIHLFAGTLYVASSNKIGNLKPTPLRPALTHNIAEHYIKPEYRK